MTAAETIGGLAIRHPRTLDEPVLGLLRAQNVCVINTFGTGEVIHSRVVWVDTDGTDVLVNSVGGRVWMRDLEHNPNVTCTVVNLSNPYEFVSIEGTVVERSGDGAGEHIDALARKYLGLEVYPFHNEKEPRLLIRIRPERILHIAPEDPAVGAPSGSG